MSDSVDALEMLSLQLSEVEMLGCMFPNQGEFEIDDPQAVADVQNVVDGSVPFDLLESRLGFSLRLQTETPQTAAANDRTNELEMVCRLPHEYPSIPPVIFLRAPFLSRSKHRALSDELQNFLQSQTMGELSIGPAVDWLKENVDTYIDKTSNCSVVNSKAPKAYDTMFSRMWIYSHHIYSKIKRKDILEFTAELNLTGFTLPGKPGMIVIEGYNCHVEEFWGRIRRMQWKKITMKEKEDKEIGSGDVDELRIFKDFEEKSFEPRAGRSKRSYHMDLGLLYKYLEERNCGHIFNLYFGVDGKCDVEGDD